MQVWKLRIGYGAADLASNLVFAMMASYLMIFYTDVFGLSVAIAGTLMLVTRIIDSFTDVAMGLIIDRTHSRWGKSRPYILFGAIPYGLIAIATFYVPDFSMTGKVIYAFVTYIALSCAYTVVNIPLSTILPTLTSDTTERNILVTVRMIFSLLGATIVTTFTTPLVETLGHGNAQDGYFYTMCLYALIAVGLFFFTFTSTKETVISKKVKKSTSVLDDIKSLNLQCILYYLVFCTYFAIYTIRSSAIMYYFTYNLDRVDLIPMVGLLGTFSGLPILLLLPFIISKIGKKNTVYTGAIVYFAGSLLFIMGSSTALLMAALVITGVGMYLMQATFFAIMPDVIDYTEYKSYKSISGLICSSCGFLIKLSLGVSGLIVGLVLDFFDYVPNATQTAEALTGIEVVFIWLPAICCGVIALGMSVFKVESKMSEVESELARRRA